LKLSISEEDCLNAQLKGHGYCRGCGDGELWGIERDKNVNHFKLLEEMLKDVIRIVAFNEDKMKRLIAYWKRNKYSFSKTHYKISVKKMIEFGEELISAQRWLYSDSDDMGSMKWVAKLLDVNHEELRRAMVKKIIEMRG